ncbi:hypothetical protein NEUTE1DRAFT_149652 [Neurospora tetrasperma FGSC 2508]|uniref:Heparan-alpha-glucosaminide N-acetyltransferase catalytic domain-containing protein n=1 Tax=Neurospora tetrasperma (strain FGSC 2508 / ATCC MYA-4615 / P0657) TaxID=510951 RepID=F8MZD8_NEUT8|nr:uncharacterized protein NEUTE1DRAFT_149652 [Neurospora tetrasperma FGSC 2508]EGO52029.1 hypothetical protein NEUTE1DRAFT_149652 [Neurospora tetrasperma FGSC 2508]
MKTQEPPDSNRPAQACQVDIPEQPDSAVQETSFAADAYDASSDLQVLDHEPIPDEEWHAQNGQSSALESQSNHQHGTYGYGSFPHTLRTGHDGHHKSTARALAPDLLRGLLMVLMALDHNSMVLQSWDHGTAAPQDETGAPQGENDSIPVHKWNHPIAHHIRVLAHLCAPGFTFLLGMGIVYFGRSRTSLGWSTTRMAWHFFTRAVVLTLVMIVMSLGITLGDTWFLNIVLFALAVDYLLSGLIWLVTAKTEKMLAFIILKVLPEKKEDDATEPLLANRRGVEDIAPDRAIIRAADISWHIHNVVLSTLAVVTIWWNIWLSPTNGHCGVEPVQKLPDTILARIWFYRVFDTDWRIISVFPPLAWISFAILGLVAGRIILARSWSTKAIAVGNLLAGIVFTIVFVGTRFLNAGNLSEGCLHMPEHERPDAPDNQYLASWRSFIYLIKYPPDVAFWAFTMAGNLFLFAFFSVIPPRLATIIFEPLLVFGTSALFFFVGHLTLQFALVKPVRHWFGHVLAHPDPWNPDQPAVGVDNLWIFFGFWLLVLAILYPLCKWYGAFKRRRGSDSIFRFF